MSCLYYEGWKNEEGWLVLDNGRLICLDWDDFCTECRIDDSKDCTFQIVTQKNTKEKQK